MLENGNRSVGISLCSLLRSVDLNVVSLISTMQNFRGLHQVLMLTPENCGVDLGSICITGAVGMVCVRHQLPPAHQCQIQSGAAGVGRDNLGPDVGICPLSQAQTALVLLGQTLSSSGGWRWKHPSEKQAALLNPQNMEPTLTDSLSPTFGKSNNCLHGKGPAVSVSCGAVWGAGVPRGLLCECHCSEHFRDGSLVRCVCIICMCDFHFVLVWLCFTGEG